MGAIAKTSLYFSEGSSDKEYHAEIVAVAGGNVVNFRYGRRGASLTVGTKTSAPVDFAQAKKIYDKLVKEKTSKGYTPDVSGAAYQGTANAGLKTDFTPQLLNPITEDEAMRLIADDRWAAQEKMDGERRAAHADANSVTGMNRKGLSVPLPQAIAEELQSISANIGAIRVDGEIKGAVRVPHSTTFDPVAVKQELGLGMSAWEVFMANIKAMSNRPVNKFEAMSYLVNVLGDPALPLNEQPNQKGIQTVYGLYSGEGKGSKLQSAAGTTWGLVNSITEYVDIHRRARNQDYRLDSAWFGQGAQIKQKAFDGAMALAA